MPIAQREGSHLHELKSCKKHCSDRQRSSERSNGHVTARCAWCVFAGGRARDLILIAYADAVAKHMDIGKLCIHVSQSVERKPWSEGFRSLTTNSSIFFVPQGRIVKPIEHFKILGFSEQHTRCVTSPGVARDLAGESMAPPVIATVMLAAAGALAKPWTRSL